MLTGAGGGARRCVLHRVAPHLPGAPCKAVHAFEAQSSGQDRTQGCQATAEAAARCA